MTTIAELTASTTDTRPSTRYEIVDRRKATGATYTPTALADFVAAQMVLEWDRVKTAPLRILDPAAGTGELLASLIKQLPSDQAIEVTGFDSDSSALAVARDRLESLHPKMSLRLACEDFLKVAFSDQSGLFDDSIEQKYQFIIANLTSPRI